MPMNSSGIAVRTLSPGHCEGRHANTSVAKIQHRDIQNVDHDNASYYLVQTLAIGSIRLHNMTDVIPKGKPRL